MKNKIGILTWYNSSNYGTCLQAYALYHFLKKNGFDPYFIANINVNQYANNMFSRFVLKIKHVKIRLINKYKVNLSVTDEKKNKIENFVDKYNVIDILSEEDMKNVEKEFVGFISGGDQIWNPNFLATSYLQDFVSGAKFKKVSYGTSIGVKKLPHYIKKLYKNLWDDYTAISVREQSAKNIIDKLCDTKVKVVADPVFLLERYEYEELILKNNYMTHSQYIVCYFVGENPEYAEYVKDVKEKTGYDVYNISLNSKASIDNNLYDVGVEDFLELISKASIVITDSFHASVFSMIFHREFYVLKRFSDEDKKSQNDRLYNLLKNYNVIDRMVENNHEFIRNENIDYVYIDNKKHNEWIESNKFIIENLK